MIYCLHVCLIVLFAGLLDVPICAVNDDGYFANPRYSLQFPPSNFDQKLLSSRIPVNAINVNSSLHPINTVTGLQYFTGLRNYPFRERAIPRIGLGKNVIQLKYFKKECYIVKVFEKKSYIVKAF